MHSVDTPYLLRIYVLLLLFVLAVAAPHSPIAAVFFFSKNSKTSCDLSHLFCLSIFFWHLQ
jgi:hypothetical protein